MKATELRTKSYTQLTEQLQLLFKELFNLRVQQKQAAIATDQAKVVKTHTFKIKRRQIAQIKTILNEKKYEFSHE